MPDEVEVYARLESPLYGCLLQVLDTLSRTVEADCAAARVFGLDESAIDTCTLHARLRLKARQSRALRDWPNHDGNLFELMRRVQPPPGIGRPRDHVDEATYASADLYRQLEVSHHVADCLCESMDLGDGVWALLCYLRCAPSLPFQEEQLAMLRRFHPTTQRLVQAGFRRELRPVTAVTAATAEVKTVPLSQLLARLSRTECQVLGYLRTSLTEKQIADEVDRSHHTVHVHVKNIYRKFSISSRKQLMQLFIEK